MKAFYAKFTSLRLYGISVSKTLLVLAIIAAIIFVPFTTGLMFKLLSSLGKYAPSYLEIWLMGWIVLVLGCACLIIGTIFTVLYAWVFYSFGKEVLKGCVNLYLWLRK